MNALLLISLIILYYITLNKGVALIYRYCGYSFVNMDGSSRMVDDENFYIQSSQTQNFEAHAWVHNGKVLKSF